MVIHNSILTIQFSQPGFLRPERSPLYFPLVTVSLMKGIRHFVQSITSKYPQKNLGEGTA
jgi:hypothetical protein